MKTLDEATGIDPQEQADHEAVMRQWLEGIPADPEVIRRVEERAKISTERIRRLHGLVDDATFQSLLSDDDEA